MPPKICFQEDHCDNFPLCNCESEHKGADQFVPLQTTEKVSGLQ
ncbi:MAG: hypothetical protein Hyperionvirus3_53 [Hyperionvirus sp.]|uniref:Uncharacterized protein n=1 Tax=Hyperionvirus sp. TaxID=2487770 RepID=A0A3G5A6N8_9VIRU|nr:MAG: hypothetical protein Hyperionvirus3_53 [Hyperionvirus sp.]